MTFKIAALLATASGLAIAAPAAAQVEPAAPQTPALPQTAADTPGTQPGATTPSEGSAQDVAQPAQASGGDIVVTAQRRKELVTKVPISITVASQGQLQRQQVNTVNDLSRIAPALEIQQAPGQNVGGGGSIRGIGTQTFSAGAIASVGIVVDQVSQGNANVSDLFDVARVEVLKGPQGTLFGLTTSAGVINITTNAPDPTRFSAYTHTELSDAGTAGSKYGNQVVQGVVNLPIAENAALRVSGLLNRRQGPLRNAIDGNLNDTNRYGFRGRFLWKPTSDLSINLIGDYTRTKIDQGGDFFTFIRAAGAGEQAFGGALVDPVGITARLASCGVTVGSGNRDYCTSQRYSETLKNYGGSLQVDYDAGPFTVTSITAYRHNTERGFGAATDVFRADPLELQVANGAVNRRLRLFTQEVRLTSPSDRFFEYTVGAFFSNQRELRDPESLSVTLSPFPGLTIPISSSQGANDTIRDESMAVFGQGTVHVTPRLRLIAGGRLTGEKISLDRNNLDLGADDREQLRVKSEKVSYRFGAQYDLTSRAMVYATASKGYKGGQIATPALPLLPFTVKPERPMDYELGFKTTILGGWVVDLNGFYTKIQDFQSQQCTVNPANSVISCVQTNIDGVKTRGAEINLFGRVFQGMSVNTGFIYAKATYPGGYVGTDGTNIGGKQLTYAPRYKFTFSGEYEHPITESFKGFVSGDAVWKSRIHYEANSLRETSFHQHWLAGGRLGVRTADDRFAIAVFGRNLFNVHEPVLEQSSFPYNGAANVGAIYGPQSFRQVGLSVDAKF